MHAANRYKNDWYSSIPPIILSFVQFDSRGASPTEITDGIFLLGGYRSTTWVLCNTYLIIRDNAVVLIDPGPITLFPKNLVALRKVTDVEAVSAVVATQATLDALSSLSLWEKAGLRAPVFAHWWSSIVIGMSGTTLPSKYFHDRNIKTTSPGPDLSALFFNRFSDTGNIGLYDSRSKTLFSGDLFGAVEGTPASELSRISTFNRRLFQDDGIHHRVLRQVRELAPAKICPQHGSVIDTESKQVLPFLLDMLNTPSPDAESDV